MLKWKLVLFLLVGLTSNAYASNVFSLSANSCQKIFESPEQNTVIHSGLKTVDDPFVSTPTFKRSISKLSPFEQSSAVLINGQQALAFGNKSAIERIEQSLNLFKDILLDTTFSRQLKHDYTINGEQVSILNAAALSGSTPISRAYSDIDSEILLISKHPKFHPREFLDANSLTTKGFAHHIKKIVQEGIKNRMIFSDFKAGEYDYLPKEAQETKSRAIKWTAAEILAGEKIITKGSEEGDRYVLTLEEAITSEARTKIDWLVEVKDDSFIEDRTGLKKRYVEVSVLFILGGQRGEGTPTLRLSSNDLTPPIGATGAHVAEKNKTQLLPVRTTTVFFDEAQFALAREASISSPTVDIRFLNDVVLNSIKLHHNQRNFLKVLKLLYTRFFYWNDFQHFLEANPKLKEVLKTPSDLQDAIGDIVHAPVIEALSVLKATALVLQRLKDLGQQDSASEAEYISSLQKTIYKFGQEKKEFKSFESAFEYNIFRLNREVETQLSKNSVINEYINYALGLNYSVNFDFSQTDSAFMSFKLPDAFTTKYKASYSELIEKYPNVLFSRPEDLHMTIAFFGTLTNIQLKNLKELISSLKEILVQYPIDLSNSSLKIIGSKNSQLAIVFDVAQMPQPVLKAILEFKAKLAQLGIKPDAKHSIDDFLPHISIAYVRGMHFDAETHRQVNELLFEDSLYVENMQLSGNLDMQFVRPARARQLEESRYTIEDTLD